MTRQALVGIFTIVSLIALFAIFFFAAGFRLVCFAPRGEDFCASCMLSTRLG